MYWEDPTAATTSLRLKVLLVVGIGLFFHSKGDKHPNLRNMAHKWIGAAQTWLSGSLEKDRLNIIGIQIHCLTLLARQLFSIDGDLVAISAGSLITSAIQIGLHRDPKYLPSMWVLQAEIRRRLWATILELVVQSSLDSAIPTRITLDDFDTQAPSDINDDDIDEFTTIVPTQASKSYITFSPQLMLFRSLPIRLKTLHLLNNVQSELSYHDVLTLSSEITNACEVNRRFTKVIGSPDMTPFHRNLLDYLVRRFLLPLHCAFAMKARTNELFYYSRMISVETAMAIILPEPDDDFSHIMAIGGGLFREGLMQAPISISAELIAQTEDQRDHGTLHCMTLSREQLKNALRKMVNVSLQRLKHSETSIKSHLFFSMVLAHVEAIEAGLSCEFKIAHSAIESLEFCHELLLEQAGILSTSCIDHTDQTATASATVQDDYGFGLDLDLDLDMEFFFSEASAT